MSFGPARTWAEQGNKQGFPWLKTTQKKTCIFSGKIAQIEFFALFESPQKIPKVDNLLYDFFKTASRCCMSSQGSVAGNRSETRAAYPKRFGGFQTKMFCFFLGEDVFLKGLVGTWKELICWWSNMEIGHTHVTTWTYFLQIATEYRKDYGLSYLPCCWGLGFLNFSNHFEWRKLQTPSTTIFHIFHPSKFAWRFFTTKA